MKITSLFACVALASLTACVAQPARVVPAHTFAIGTNDFLLDGQRFQIRCGGEICVNLRESRMVVGAAGFNPLEFEGVGNCGEFAIIGSRTDGPASFLIPSNSMELEFRQTCLMQGGA